MDIHDPLFRTIGKITDLQKDLGVGEKNVISVGLSLTPHRLTGIGRRISEVKDSLDAIKEYPLRFDYDEYQTMLDVKTALLDLFSIYELATRISPE